MTSPWRQLGLATSIGALRVFALSVVLSGLTTYGLGLGGSLAEVGFAFGAYALAAAIFQVPFGILADRVGTRTALVAGLALTVAGSILAAFATDIVMLSAGRFIAGAGAINGVASALAADAFPEARRTRALALFGAAIGAAFTLGLVVGPLLAVVTGMAGLFALQAVLAGVALVPVLTMAATAPSSSSAARARATAGGLAGLHAAGFATNFALSITIFAFPLATAGILSDADRTWVFPLLVVLGGVVMFASARSADRGRIRLVVALGAVGLGVGPLLLLHAPVLAGVLAGAWLLFAAQSTLAAALPSAVSRFASRGRAAAQSMLTLSQSFGTAAGGLVAGVLFTRPPALAVVTLAVAAVGGFLATRALAPTAPADPAREAAPLEREA